MSRDTHLDAMLRHLGAAYYESMHGRASAADVARARAVIEERLGEQPGDGSPAGGQDGAQAPHRRAQHHGRWHGRVRDVMTTDVVTVDRITPYKEIARLLAEHRISAVPVLVMGRHVAGVVSEDDLLAAQDRRRAGRRGRLRWPRGGDRRPRLTAGELMTAPAITIHPDAPIAMAARLMHDRHVKRLPVVAPDGTLAGIVSRRDLLSVFLRPDAQIARETRDLLTEILFADATAIHVTVRGGVVTLTGQPDATTQPDLIPVAVRLIRDIDGVLDVTSRIAPAAPAST